MNRPIITFTFAACEYTYPQTYRGTDGSEIRPYQVHF
jgi:hypothetical protein